MRQSNPMKRAAPSHARSARLLEDDTRFCDIGGSAGHLFDKHVEMDSPTYEWMDGAFFVLQVDSLSASVHKFTVLRFSRVRGVVGSMRPSTSLPLYAEHE